MWLRERTAFGLGSVMYNIVTDEEPYGDANHREVAHRFHRVHFPETGHSCMAPSFKDAGAALSPLQRMVYWP